MKQNEEQRLSGHKDAANGNVIPGRVATKQCPSKQIQNS
jgi:hypothetical protein